MASDDKSGLKKKVAAESEWEDVDTVGNGAFAADPLKTGKGMEAYAQRQAGQDLREMITRPGPATIDPTERKAAQEGYAAARGIYPGYDEKERPRLSQVLARQAAQTAPLYIPGPGGRQLLSQVVKGAAYGGGAGALEHGLVQAGRGRLPTVEGTLKAAGTGALFGGALGPLAEVPSIRRLAQRLPYIRRMVPEAEAAAPEVVGAGATAAAAEGGLPTILDAQGNPIRPTSAGSMTNVPTPGLKNLQAAGDVTARRELGRRGTAALGDYSRAPLPPAEPRIPLKSKVAGGFQPGEGIAAARPGSMPTPQPDISRAALIDQMQDAFARGNPEEKAMALQRLQEMGVKPLEKFRSAPGEP